jgi:hypothetical protein
LGALSIALGSIDLLTQIKDGRTNMVTTNTRTFFMGRTPCLVVTAWRELGNGDVTGITERSNSDRGFAACGASQC